MLSNKKTNYKFVILLMIIFILWTVTSSAQQNAVTTSPKTPEQDRLYLALASYNAGYGRILNASKKLKTDTLLWQQVKPYLPRETRGYVGRIKSLMGTAS